MKANEWFVCLNYGRLELLIPQSDILESFYAPQGQMLSWEKHAKSFSLDSFVEKVFGIKTEGAETSRMLAKSEEVLVAKTGRTPKVLQMDYESFHLSKGVLGSALIKKGFLAIRFEEKKIQYMVDINALSKCRVE